MERTEGGRLLIRLSPDGEILADHKLASGKGGQLVQDHTHKRKRSTKLTEWENEIISLFEDEEKIKAFMNQLRERYPRHMGDQLAILWNLLQQEPKMVNQALDRAMELRLTSANDLRDLLYSLIQETPSQKVDTKSSESPYAHIDATTRQVDSYIEILKGGDSQHDAPHDTVTGYLSFIKAGRNR
ncbi:mobile element protein [Gracilibacillus boraciitolerans JCM 21714]|uniref:Mobile element protein n=1 Tax=Gracilibacillus boraciitolerans JCM 21714 TaxID=1298598 RepID=W4VKQ1_9BACI|nr:hypothetical protein [Gracilibacillus boraciitolerans]GAE93797.1 mobile element protein [Gracilibacillus boraciitolerans JCM 21714]